MNKAALKLLGVLKTQRDASLAFRMVFAFLPGITAIARAQDAGSNTAILDDTGIIDIICGIVNTLTGPIGIAIGVAVLAIGGLMIAFGGKRAISFVIWGIIGVGIALAAPTLLTTLFPDAFDAGGDSCGVTRS